MVQRCQVGDAHPFVFAHYRIFYAGRTSAHATEAEAKEETMRMLETYAHFAEKYLALPVIKGEKTPLAEIPRRCRYLHALK